MSSPSSPVYVRLAPGALLLALTLAAPSVLAQPKPPEGSVYTCIDDSGRRITADRPITECTGKEQRILNRDGSLRAVLPPTLTADERAEKEARDRKAAEQRAAQADAVRRDRNLAARYPNEQAHQRAREAALDTARDALQASEKRLKTLAAERKPLLVEAESYTGKPLPVKLRQEMDANDALTEAQRAAIATQEAELQRINRNYDEELERLRRLWAGAAPGSLGPLPAAHAGTPAATPAPKR